MNDTIDILKGEALSLLQELISLPSFSKEEWQTASAISKYLAVKGVASSRIGNNVFATNKNFDAFKPSILLNSHHDTVKPNAQYTRDPFQASIVDGKLYGLGSNDAGGCLVSLIAVFLHFYERDDLAYNLIIALTAEEEISGTGGIENLLPHLPPIDCGIVGEPTQMNLAIAERGLLVLDCVATGKAGHAAREEGDNAIYKAVKDISWIQSHPFTKVSEVLGPVKMSVTVMETANKAHNQVPETCQFVVDVRVNELYTLEEIFEEVKHSLTSSVTPRSLRLRSSAISLAHPLVKAGLRLGKSYYGSPTTSDKALMPFPTLKIGPGDSARSHSADEFIYLTEIEEGIDLYIQLLNQVL
ncbi:MAG: acetylornithine deacetylase [Flaviaesturariibacter sp.]|nr:acetylornithine deacetylase [Flaviaesturariibacter sp.]